MKHLPRRKRFIYGVISLACVAAQIVNGADNIAGDIRDILQSQQQAWNRGDIEAFMNGYSRSTSTTFVSDDTVSRGWQTVHNRYKRKYSDRAKMGRLIFSELEITPLSAGSAMVMGRWKLTRVKDQPNGRFTLIFRRLPEGWRIVHDHTSAAPQD